MSLYKRQLYLNLKVILTLQIISNINDNWGIRKYNLADNYINLADNCKLVLSKSHEDTSSIYSTTCIYTCYPVLFLATALFFYFFFLKFYGWLHKAVFFCCCWKINKSGTGKLGFIPRSSIDLTCNFKQFILLYYS